MTNYDSLSARELDAAVARYVMGEPQPVGGPGLYEVISIWHEAHDEQDPCSIPGWRTLRFSTDDNAARLVRDKIAEMGLGNLFCNEINNQLAAGYTTRFSYMQSTPRQQCIAALRAVRRRKG